MKGFSLSLQCVAALFAFMASSSMASAQGWGGAGYYPCLPYEPMWNHTMPSLTATAPWQPAGQPFMPPAMNNPIVKEPQRRIDAKPPRVIESRSSQTPVHEAKKVDVPTGPCRVGFWNVTGRDVTLRVAGRSVPVPRDRAVALNLEHHFTWQSDDGASHTVDIPDAKKSHEVIIR